jgi:hypothetical protein
LSQARIDEPAQLAQPISPQQGATGTDLDYKVRLQNVGPFDR